LIYYNRVENVASASLPDNGLVIFAKRECETCAMVEPVIVS
jgi:hypothetical protein